MAECQRHQRTPKCPRCGAPLKTRTSRMASPDARRIYRRCRNVQCRLRCASWQYYETSLNLTEQKEKPFSFDDIDCYEA
ncbi:ogr/Delta-like zinc finger family protein [Serratia marcescens]|uniref:ogr/Delta-like zinc finger family protein n=1 Tax=Serratia marcescens TaxID=615 RepID=UPI003D6F9A9D